MRALLCSRTGPHILSFRICFGASGILHACPLGLCAVWTSCLGASRRGERRDSDLTRGALSEAMAPWSVQSEKIRFEVYGWPWSVSACSSLCPFSFFGGLFLFLFGG